MHFNEPVSTVIEWGKIFQNVVLLDSTDQSSEVIKSIIYMKSDPKRWTHCCVMFSVLIVVRTG